VGIRRALIALVLAAACLGWAEEREEPVPQRIKAAFLSKFPAYVDWPARAFQKPESPLVIGVSGAETVAREVAEAVAGRTVAGRPMQVHRIAPDEDMDDCCHVLYVGADTDRARASELLQHTRGRPVLTVTELEHQPPGSVINFLVVDNRVRFDISRPAAENNGLQIRSQLLAVARQATAR
jgi:hypothetical protein